MGCVSSKGYRPTNPSRISCYSPLSCYVCTQQYHVDHDEEFVGTVTSALIPYEELNPETYQGSFLYMGSRYKQYKTINPLADVDDASLLTSLLDSQHQEACAGTNLKMHEEERKSLLVHDSSEGCPRRCNASMRYDVEVIDAWVLMEEKRHLSGSPFSQSLRKASSRTSSLIGKEDARSFSSRELLDAKTIGVKLLLSSANSSFHCSPSTQRKRSRSASYKSFDGNARSLQHSEDEKYGHLCGYFDDTKSPYRSCNATRHGSKKPSTESIYDCGSPLFDPSLMAAFEWALKATTEAARHGEWVQFGMDGGTELSSSSADTWASSETMSDAESLPFWHSRENPPSKALLIDEADLKLKRDLTSYGLKCPPRGEGKIVLYFTSLRGVRKTYEDCCDLRLILRGLGARVDERDVWMHASFKNELMDLLCGEADRTPPQVPQLFIKGRHIGGAEEVKQLHEEDILAHLMDGLALGAIHNVCDGCGDVRFLPCFSCSGSCKVVSEDNEVFRCRDCNENGLIMCPMCIM